MHTQQGSIIPIYSRGWEGNHLSGVPSPCLPEQDWNPDSDSRAHGEHTIYVTVGQTHVPTSPWELGVGQTLKSAGLGTTLGSGRSVSAPQASLSTDTSRSLLGPDLHILPTRTRVVVTLPILTSGSQG